jgi:FeS assembly SUF system protein
MNILRKFDRFLGREPMQTEPDLRDQVIEALRQIRDPEIPINIYDLGLVYGLDIDEMGRVDLRMTLTAPACPVAQTFPAQVKDALEAVPGVSRADVELVWEPPWNPSRLSEAARLQLGLL